MVEFQSLMQVKSGNLHHTIFNFRKYLWVLCENVYCIQKSIRPFGHFEQWHFELCTFRFYVISNFYGISTIVLFDPMLFRSLDLSQIVNSTVWTFRNKNISTLGLFGFMSFRLLDILYQCHFELWTFKFNIITNFYGILTLVLFNPVILAFVWTFH